MSYNCGVLLIYCMLCHIVCSVKLSTVSNCQKCQIVSVIKLSALSNCPLCQIVRGVKLSYNCGVLLGGVCTRYYYERRQGWWRGESGARHSSPLFTSNRNIPQTEPFSQKIKCLNGHFSPDNSAPPGPTSNCDRTNLKTSDWEPGA